MRSSLSGFPCPKCLTNAGHFQAELDAIVHCPLVQVSGHTRTRYHHINKVFFARRMLAVGIFTMRTA